MGASRRGPALCDVVGGWAAAYSGHGSPAALSASAEVLQGSAPAYCELPVATYAGPAGFAWRLVQAPLIMRWLARRLAALRPDVAICAMPGPLDLLMLSALRRIRVPAVVVVHDADAHPGEVSPLPMYLQRRLMHRADAVATLSEHVAARLTEQRLVSADKLFIVSHPPFAFGPIPSPPRAMAARCGCSASGACCRTRGSICWHRLCASSKGGAIGNYVWWAADRRARNWRHCAHSLV